MKKGGFTLKPTFQAPARNPGAPGLAPQAGFRESCSIERRNRVYSSSAKGLRWDRNQIEVWGRIVPGIPQAIERGRGMCLILIREDILFAVSAIGLGFLPAGAKATEPIGVDAPGLLGAADPFVGSTIVSISPSGFQLELIYRKFPSDEFVGPADVWQISFGAVLASAAPSALVTLRLASPGQNPDIQISDDTATFVPEGGLYHNYASPERFEIEYTGNLDPFVGPIDFVLEPDGLAEIPVRVHLNAVEQPGFPVPSHPLSTGGGTPMGNIIGDGKMEILFSGQVGGVGGLYAFDLSGGVLPGWPLSISDPGIANESYSAPNLVDLDRDGLEEIVVMGSFTRDVQSRGTTTGTTLFKTLTVADGSGAIRWQIEDQFESSSIPAVADLDGDADLDIVVGGDSNVKRFEIDGTPFASWQVETSNDIHVSFPVIADVDGNSANGLEIVACADDFAPQAPERIYVWNQDGSVHSPMWPKAVEGGCVPVTVVDLDSEPGNGLEIIMGIDHNENPPVDPGSGFLNTFSVFAWHANGSEVGGWPVHFLRDPNLGFTDDRILSGATAGDVDGDGDIEVVLGTYGLGNPDLGNLFVFHDDGTLDANWPQWAGIAQTPSNWGGTALGDLDGDGLLEIVTASFTGVYVFRANGQLFEGFPRLSTDDFSQPMIADLDGDGHVEIVASSLGEGLFAWKLSTNAPDPRPWSRFRQNPGNTGALLPPPVVEVPTMSTAGGLLVFGLVVCSGSRMIRQMKPRSSW